MRLEDGQYVDLLIGDEPIMRAEKIRFEVAIGSQPRKARALATPTRLLFYSRTPMGLQLTLVRFADVDHVTAGRRKHDPYLQLLGDASRILLIFKSNKKRDAFRQFLESRLEHAQPVARPRRIAVGA